MPQKVAKGGDGVGEEMVVFRVESPAKVWDEGSNIFFKLLVVVRYVPDRVYHVLLEAFRIVYRVHNRSHDLVFAELLEEEGGVFGEVPHQVQGFVDELLVVGAQPLWNHLHDFRLSNVWVVVRFRPREMGDYLYDLQSQSIELLFVVLTQFGETIDSYKV